MQSRHPAASRGFRKTPWRDRRRRRGRNHGGRADKGQRGDAGRHLAAPQIIEAGRPRRRTTRGAKRLLPCGAGGARAAVRLDEPLRAVLARPLRQPAHLAEGDRSMNIALQSDTREIVVEANLPHAPEAIWKALTTGELIGRWLQMTPTGFEAVKGKQFTYQTKAAGGWDGVIHCRCWRGFRTQASANSWKAGTRRTSGYGVPSVTAWT